MKRTVPKGTFREHREWEEKLLPFLLWPLAMLGAGNAYRNAVMSSPGFKQFTSFRTAMGVK